MADIPTNNSTCKHLLNFLTIHVATCIFPGKDCLDDQESLSYRIAGNFRGVQFSRMWGFEAFRVLIFEDQAACMLARYRYMV